MPRRSALLAMVGAGEFKNIEVACAATIKVVSETPLDRGSKATDVAGFPVYQDLYQSLRRDFKRISAWG